MTKATVVWTGGETAAYRKAIDALIPRAQAEALKRAGAEPLPKHGQEHETWAAKHDRAFHMAMDRMAAAAGIRRQAYQGSEEN